MEKERPLGREDMQPAWRIRFCQHFNACVVLLGLHLGGSAFTVIPHPQARRSSLVTCRAMLPHNSARWNGLYCWDH
jgi:hypothetical protein